MSSSFFQSEQTQIILFFILVFGALGGFAGNFLDNAVPKTDRRPAWQAAVLGILAAGSVPLFLHIVSSDLIKGAASEGYKYWVFGGFCIIMAVFAERFLRGIGDNIMKQLTELKTKVAETEEKADAAIENSSNQPVVEIPAGATDEPTDTDSGETSEHENFELDETGDAAASKSVKKPKKRGVSAAPAPVRLAPPRDRILDALRQNRPHTFTAYALGKLGSMSETEAAGWLVDLEKTGSVKRISTAAGKDFWKAV